MAAMTNSEEQQRGSPASSKSSSQLWNCLKLLSAAALCISAYHLHSSANESRISGGDAVLPNRSRRLQQLGINQVPSYMTKLMEDLIARKKLFEDTPAEEIKYWFEYSGSLQVRLLFRMERVSMVWLCFCAARSVGKDDKQNA